MCIHLQGDRWGTLSVTKSHSLPFKQPAVSHCCCAIPSQRNKPLNSSTGYQSHILTLLQEYADKQQSLQEAVVLCHRHFSNPEVTLTPEALGPDVRAATAALAARHCSSYSLSRSTQRREEH